MRTFGALLVCLGAFACHDEPCTDGALRCTREGVEQCVVTQCSIVSMHSSWSLVQRCASDEMCSTDGCASADGGVRPLQLDPGADCSVH